MKLRGESKDLEAAPKLGFIFNKTIFKFIRFKYKFYVVISRSVVLGCAFLLCYGSAKTRKNTVNNCEIVVKTN